MVRIIYQAAPNAENSLRQRLETFAESTARVVASFFVFAGFVLIVGAVFNAIYPNPIEWIAERAPFLFVWLAVELFALSCENEGRRGYVRTFYLPYIIVKVVDLTLLSVIVLYYTTEAIKFYTKALNDRSRLDVLIGGRRFGRSGPLEMTSLEFFFLYAIVAILWLMHVSIVPTAWRTYKFLGSRVPHRVSTTETIVSNV